MPAFTVVLSAFNEERLVGEAIGSVLAQTCSDFELIVVDDGSEDGTSDVVGEFLTDTRVRLIKHENRGLAPSLNIGAAAGTAPRIALIDADDLWFPEFLDKLGGALDSAPGAGFAYTDAWWLQEASGRFFRKSSSEYLGAPEQPPSDPHELLLALLPGNWIFGLTAIDRAAFEAVGGFNEALAGGEDYELWMRLLAAGRAAARAPGRLVVQRDRAGSMSRNFPAMLANLKAVYRIVAEELEVPDDVRGLARKRIEEIDRHIEADRSRANPLAARWAMRSMMGRLRKRLVPGAVWHRGTPPEVRQAFPNTDFGPKPARSDG